MSTAGVWDGLQEKLKKEKEKSLPGCLPSDAPALHWAGSLLTACCSLLKRALSCQNEAIREKPSVLFRGQTGNIFCSYPLPFPSSALFFLE